MDLDTTIGEDIWFNDMRGFLHLEHMLRFFPIQRMTLEEKLNASLRLSIYFAIIMLIAGRGSRILLAPMAVAFGTYCMYMSMQDARSSSGVEKYAAARSSGGAAKTEKAIPVDKKCTRPSKHNPFMNVLQSDYFDSPDRGAACDIQDPRVSETSEDLFAKAGSGLVRDVDDVFHRRASSRQFVTNPATTIPNDQTDFAMWLYGKPPTQEDIAACKQLIFDGMLVEGDVAGAPGPVLDDLLSCAVFHNRLEAVEVLISAGARPSMADFRTIIFFERVDVLETIIRFLGDLVIEHVYDLLRLAADMRRPSVQCILNAVMLDMYNPDVLCYVESVQSSM